jgi:hypothetical protein
MTSTHLRSEPKTRPLVAAICSVSLLGEVIIAALELATVRSVAERGGDVEGLLGWLRSDALISNGDGPTQAAIRNVVVGALLARGGLVR